MAPVKKTATKVASTKVATTKAKATAKTAKPKAAAKKTAAKKTAAVKKTATKKTAAVKKTAAKKTAVKTASVKKAAAKTAAVKTTAVKKATAKKTEAKTAVEKKAAAKKAEVKTAIEKKPAVRKKPPVVKEAASEKNVETAEANVKFRNLFDAFAQGKLPFAFGYIVSSFFNDKNAYSIYEIVSYAGVKEIFPTDNGLQFTAGGKKLHILVEHDTYAKKYEEPVSRAEGERIPKRFSELETIIAKNQTRIMVAKEPNELTGSFTILKPFSLNFAVVFYQQDDVYKTLADFFEKSLNLQRKVPQFDAKRAATLIAATVEKTMGFKGEFE